MTLNDPGCMVDVFYGKTFLETIQDNTGCAFDRNTHTNKTGPFHCGKEVIVYEKRV
ncbi:MAG: hypothetical protein HCAMLNBO_02446 [Candidatus Brocadia fulgida]|nr:hypothetical protein [Candidatus Brocadia fulgida]